MLVLEDYIRLCREINERYKKQLMGILGISFQNNPSRDFESNMWLSCIIIDSKVAGFTREELILEMEAENIETRLLWKPMHLQPIFEKYPFYGKGGSSRNTEFFSSKEDLPEIDNSISGQLFKQGHCLPSHPGLTNDDLNRVINVIKKHNK